MKASGSSLARRWPGSCSRGASRPRSGFPRHRPKTSQWDKSRTSTHETTRSWSARPDLSIDGNVVIQRLDDVTYVGRPAYGQANQRVGMFKLVEDGQFAERVNVMLGASSVNEIAVIEGLQEGDIVILSDMSNWDGFDRVRLRN